MNAPRQPADMNPAAEALCERLLAGCLARAEAQVEDAIELACRVHPEVAVLLRERYRILLDSGILEDGAEGGTEG